MLCFGFETQSLCIFAALTLVKTLFILASATVRTIYYNDKNQVQLQLRTKFDISQRWPGSEFWESDNFRKNLGVELNEESNLFKIFRIRFGSGVEILLLSILL